jgi:TIR domain
MHLSYEIGFIFPVAAPMSESDKKVFISYRRSASAGWAYSVLGDLCAKGYDVFMDVNSINSGDFERVILNQIEAHAHFLLILTPGSLQRCNEPGDWLTREIEYAMKLQRNIVPLTFERFNFTSQTQYLPASLARLPKYNALEIPHGYFEDGMTKLRERFLKQPVYGVVKATPNADRAKVLDLFNASTREAAKFHPSLRSAVWPSIFDIESTSSEAITTDAATKKTASEGPESHIPFRWESLLPKKDNASPSAPNTALPPTENSIKSPFTFVKPDLELSDWYPKLIPSKVATGDYLKPGNFKLNALAIPATMLQKLEEFIAAGETIKQVAFGPDGSWIILRDWCGFWQNGVPEAMNKQLWDQLNGSLGIPHVSLSPEKGWLILRDKPHLMFLYDELPVSPLNKLRELYRADRELKCVAFAESGGWVALYGKNGFWSENIPAELLKKLHDWSDLHYELKQVAFGPNSSWVLLAGDTGWWHGNIPEKMAEKLSEYHQAGKTIKSVALSPDAGWLILGN